jgi:hypothetical protein
MYIGNERGFQGVAPLGQQTERGFQGVAPWASTEEAGVHAALLAAVQPDNTPHGYNLTFAFPELMFIIIAGALYLRFRRPHRVPGHVDLASASSQASASAARTAEPDVPAIPDAVLDDPPPTPESAEGTA